MEDLNWNYLCTAMGNLAGIPIRIYDGNRQCFSHSTLNLSRDPILACEREILAISDSVGYYVTDIFYYYGVVVFGKKRIVIGPTCQGQIPEPDLRHLAFEISVSPEERPAFLQGMRSITPMPLESLLSMLCAINYLTSGETKTLADLVIHEDTRQFVQAAVEQTRTRQEDASPADVVPHNTYPLEQNLTAIVEAGDVAALSRWAASAPAVRGGPMAPGQLRQLRNTFIVTATLISRAAIRGGMEIDEAFSLSDRYIAHCEPLQAPGQITDLQYRMITDYTERVSRIRRGSGGAKLALRVSAYVQQHLSEPLTTEEIAAALFTSRTRLSADFHRQTGQTLSHFIQGEKIEEAKRLLAGSDKSVTAISNYLAFSSSGHFSRVFRSCTGVTPGAWRSAHRQD
jgi:AraC-like DNA-binding protein